MDAARDHEAACGALAGFATYPAAATALGPSYTDAFDTGSPVSSRDRRLVLEHRLQPAL